MATRPTSAPRNKAANTSFTQSKKSSVSPVRRLPRSNNTSPIRSYISPLKDYSTYTPLLLNRDRTSSSKSTPKHTLSTSFSSEEVSRQRRPQKSTALDSLHDLRSKTEKLDQESKKFAEKVDKVRQQLQRGSRTRSKGESQGVKSLARTCLKVLTRGQHRMLSAAIDRVRAKAKRVEAMERQAHRFLARTRLKAHFAAWLVAFADVRNVAKTHLEAAVVQRRRSLKKRFFRQWAAAKSQGPSKTMPLPRKPTRRPLSASNKRLTPSESPKPMKPPNLRREEQAPVVSVPRKDSEDTQTSALMALAVEHHRVSSMVRYTQFYNVWKPWKAVVWEKNERATSHYRRILGTSVFHAWLEFYVESCEERDSAGVHELLTDSFEEAASSSHYDSIISAFRVVRPTQQTLGPRVFTRWKDFVVLSRSEKEQEKRRDMMWRKVNSWLEQYKTQT